MLQGVSTFVSVSVVVVSILIPVHVSTFSRQKRVHKLDSSMSLTESYALILSVSTQDSCVQEIGVP